MAGLGGLGSGGLVVVQLEEETSFSEPLLVPRRI